MPLIPVKAGIMDNKNPASFRRHADFRRHTGVSRYLAVHNDTGFQLSPE